MKNATDEFIDCLAEFRAVQAQLNQSFPPKWCCVRCDDFVLTEAAGITGGDGLATIHPDHGITDASDDFAFTEKIAARELWQYIRKHGAKNVSVERVDDRRLLAMVREPNGRRLNHLSEVFSCHRLPRMGDYPVLLWHHPARITVSPSAITKVIQGPRL